MLPVNAADIHRPDGAINEETPVLIAKNDQDLSESGEYSAGFVSCTVNLLKAVIGAGILAIPHSVSKLGYVPGTLVLLFATGLASFGLYLLSIIGHHHGRRSTFGSVAEKTVPASAVLFDVTVAVKCFGVATAYLSNIASQIPMIWKDFMIRRGRLAVDDSVPEWMVRWKVIWVAAALVFLSPISALPKVDSLKYTSILGMFSVLYLLVLSIVHFILTAGRGELQPIKAFVPFDLKSLTAFSVFVFAFNCHQNIFVVQNEAKRNTPAWMMRVIGMVMGTTLAVYLMFGLFSYASFTDIKDDILLTFPPGEIEFIVAKCLFVVLLACSYPLQTFPCRAALERVTIAVFPALAKSNPKIVYWGNTAFILLSSGFISSLNVKFGTVLKIIGSTAGPLICFFFPAFLFLKDGEVKKRNVDVILAKGLLVFSFISIPLSLGLVVYEIIVK